MGIFGGLLTGAIGLIGSGKIFGENGIFGGKKKNNSSGSEATFTSTGNTGTGISGNFNVNTGNSMGFGAFMSKYWWAIILPFGLVVVCIFAFGGNRRRRW